MTIDILAALSFIHEHFVSLIFFILFSCFVGVIVKMSLSNGDYKYFKLAHVVMRGDGTLDRKALRDTVLFLAQLYGFFEVLRHHETIIVEYLLTFSAIWGVYHLADNKLTNKGIPSVPGLHATPQDGT